MRHRLQQSVLALHLEAGQTLAEYALILALVAVAAVAVLLLFGNALADIFNDVINAINGVPNTP